MRKVEIWVMDLKFSLAYDLDLHHRCKSQFCLLPFKRSLRATGRRWSGAGSGICSVCAEVTGRMAVY